MTNHPATSLFEFLSCCRVRRTFWRLMRTDGGVKSEYSPERNSSKNERERIREAYAAGKTNAQLMVMFGRSSGFISTITKDIRASKSPMLRS